MILKYLKIQNFGKKKDGEIKEYDFCLKDYGVSYSKVLKI